MTPELRSLIEASVVNGNIDEQARKVILTRAEQLGITQEECGIFMASVVREKASQEIALKTEINYKAYGLIAVALIEYSYAISIGDISNAGPYIGFAVLTGSIFLLWGLHLLGYNAFKVLRRIGWLIVLLYLVQYVLYLPRKAVGLIPFSAVVSNKFSAAFSYLNLIFWLLAIVMFRVKVFGSSIITKYPNLFLGSKKIDAFRKKLISSTKVNGFIESDLTPGFLDVLSQRSK